MKNCVEMDTNEAISLERYLVICYNINVQLLKSVLTTKIVFKFE